MLKRINDLVFNNFLWKLVSLLIATILWFVGLNINNPIMNNTIELENPLEIENYDRVAANNFVLLNEESLRQTKVEVRIRASRNDFNALKGESKYIKASIDLKPIDFLSTDKVGQVLTSMVDIYIPQYIHAPSIEVVIIEPKTVSVELDHYVTKDIPIELTVHGIAAEGYVSMEPEVSPQYIQVSGAQSQLDKIGIVTMDVDIEAAVEDVVHKAKPVVYDADNRDITESLSILTHTVTVRVPVSKFTGVRLNPMYTGIAAEGYMFSNIYVKPEYIELVGDHDALSALKSINLKPTNINGANGSREEVYDIREYLDGTGLTIKEGSPYEATVTVEIVKETVKELRISLEKLRIKGLTSEVDILPGDIIAVIKGPDSRVRNITEDTVVCSVDLSSLTYGTHEVLVDFDLPSGVVIVGERPIITVSKKSPEETLTQGESSPEQEDGDGDENDGGQPAAPEDQGE